MKLLLLIFCLFIPNIYASDDAIACSYKVNDKLINFRYYITSNKKGVITNFYVDGEKYSNYYTEADNTSELACPIVTDVKFSNDSNSYYVIAKDEETMETVLKAKVFRASGNSILYDLYTSYIAQIESSTSAELVNEIEGIRYDTKEIMRSNGVADETRKQIDANIEAYAKGACTVNEKMAIYEYFIENDFNSLSTFYGDNVFKRNGEYVKLSDDCAEIASNLYTSTVNLVYILSEYADDGGDVNCMNYLSLQANYYAGYGALTTYWVDTHIDEDACGAINQDVRNILNSFFDSFRLISVILTTFMTYLDGMKCLTKKDDSETKKWISNTIKRLIILVVALLLPFLINIILDLIDKYMASSYVTVNGECVKAITGG